MVASSMAVAATLRSGMGAMPIPMRSASVHASAAPTVGERGLPEAVLPDPQFGQAGGLGGEHRVAELVGSVRVGVEDRADAGHPPTLSAVADRRILTRAAGHPHAIIAAGAPTQPRRTCRAHRARWRHGAHRDIRLGLSPLAGRALRRAAQSHWLSQYIAAVRRGRAQRQLLPLAGRRARSPRGATRLPDGFQMAVKAPRGLTHARRLREPEVWISRVTRGTPRARRPPRAADRPAATRRWSATTRGWSTSWRRCRSGPGRRSSSGIRPGWTTPSSRCSSATARPTA